MVQWVREHYSVSERHACRLVGIGRSTLRYCAHQRTDESLLRLRLRELAAVRPRFGYRRLHVLLRREGVIVNYKRVERLYREEGLAVRRRKRKRVARDGRGRAAVPGRPNQRGCLHPRGAGDRGRHLTAGRTGGAGAGAIGSRARSTGRDCPGQRPGVSRQGARSMGL